MTSPSTCRPAPYRPNWPDCSINLTYAECVSRLKAAGFERVKKTDSGSMTVPKVG